MEKKANKTVSGLSRRDFIKTSTAVSLAALTSGTGRLFAAGSDKLRVGIIGCGGRGTGAAIDCLNSADGIEIMAIGDLFKDRIDSSLEKLREKHSDKLKVTKDTSFVGFSAYKKVLACDVNLIIMAPPPHFRPVHFKAAIEAGKHVFMEKPVGVDPLGIRSVIATSQLAQEYSAAASGTLFRDNEANS